MEISSESAEKPVQRKLRWYQYSLRSLLIATAIVYLLLGIWFFFKSHVIVLTSSNFDEVALQSSQPVLVEFYADWCGPCHRMKPIVEEVAYEFRNGAKIGKLNVDDCPDIAARFKIMAVPTFVVFRNGQVVETRQGIMEKERLASCWISTSARIRRYFLS